MMGADIVFGMLDMLTVNDYSYSLFIEHIQYYSQVYKGINFCLWNYGYRISLAIMDVIILRDVGVF